MSRSKNHQIKFYVSDEELHKLKENVGKSKLKQSEFLRTMVIDNEVIVIEGLDELVTQIKKIGANLNQIAKVLNSGNIFDCNKDLQLTQKELNKIWQVLNLLAQKVQ
ncbi:MobC family plasmid mobilization relaxosome protein [Candidatus Clostridium radicumherbarum]|uniref:MobC family plasmid mobilization relaxosome protein n=1 Tax=Candidatus Clostridium radicumherbarum TaxID=3381662 RepID=A0ABW8TUG4_9CLOT